jgi:hypothetical protein
LVRYIIEKTINDYAYGLLILKGDNGKPKKFTTESEAKDFLLGLGISEQEITELYHIKPYVI